MYQSMFNEELHKTFEKEQCALKIDYAKNFDKI